MSADFKKLEERVAFLEREVRRTSALIDFVEARADKSLVGMNQHLDTQGMVQNHVILLNDQVNLK